MNKISTDTRVFDAARNNIIFYLRNE